MDKNKFLRLIMRIFFWENPLNQAGRELILSNSSVLNLLQILVTKWPKNSYLNGVNPLENKVNSYVHM